MDKSTKTTSSMTGPLRSPMAGNIANAKSGKTNPPKVAPNTTIPGSAPKSAARVQSPLPPNNPGVQHVPAVI